MPTQVCLQAEWLTWAAPARPLLIVQAVPQLRIQYSKLGTCWAKMHSLPVSEGCSIFSNTLSVGELIAKSSNGHGRDECTPLYHRMSSAHLLRPLSCTYCFQRAHHLIRILLDAVCQESPSPEVPQHLAGSSCTILHSHTNRLTSFSNAVRSAVITTAGVNWPASGALPREGA